MRNIFSLAVVLALLLWPSISHASDLFRMLGIGNRGSSAHGSDCGCDAACGCEADCGCEPSCGCGGVDGRQFAGQTWSCCHECGPPICPCTGPSRQCEPTCGCEGAPACGCEPACGCAAPCGHENVARCGCCFGSYCGMLVGVLDRSCGCTGCDGELYWSEWHNDPPRCCDPCDCHGNWIGPTAGSYRAPYAHPYYAGNRGISPVAKSVRPPTRGMTRKPNLGSNSTYQR